MLGSDRSLGMAMVDADRDGVVATAIHQTQSSLTCLMVLASSSRTSLIGLLLSVTVNEGVVATTAHQRDDQNVITINIEMDDVGKSLEPTRS